MVSKTRLLNMHVHYNVSAVARYIALSCIYQPMHIFSQLKCTYLTCMYM